MSNIHTLRNFTFPYDSHRFAGQATDERILYITREHPLFLYGRLLAVTGVTAAVLGAGLLLMSVVAQMLSGWSAAAILPVALLLAGGFLAIGTWWAYSLWQKSLAILTNKRLLKIIYTTPFNRYNQSLPLEMIVDTSCNNQGFFEGVAASLLQIGTLTARSSASSSGVATENTERVNKKYFYLENIKYCEDLQQYLNKVISLLRQSPAQLDTFRPFIPHLKGGAREQFLKEYEATKESTS